MNIPQVKPVTPSQIDPATSYAEILQRMESAQNINLAHSKTLFMIVTGLIMLGVGMYSVETGNWGVVLNLLAPMFMGGCVALAYYLFGLRRWDRMIRAIKTGDLDGDGKPDKGQALVIDVQDLKGNHRIVHNLTKSDKQDLLTMARAYNAHTSASFEIMRRNHGIGRRRWKKVNDVFLELGWIEKVGENKNDPYELRDDPAAEEGMRKLAYGDFKTVEGIWPTKQ